MSLVLILIFIFSFLGILNTLYLVSHTISKKPVLCLFFPKEWCQKVQYSSWSRTLGVPNSIAGLCFYTSIFVLTLLFQQEMISFVPAQIIIGIGTLFSIYFLAIQAFVLRAFCTWCVFSAIDFAILAVAAFLLK